MTSIKRSRLFACLITAHLASAVHLSCLGAWVMHGGRPFKALTPHEERVESIVAPILLVTHFPSWLMEGAGVVYSLITGYLFGFALAYFATKQIIQLKASSLVWWGSLLILASDVVCFSALTEGLEDYRLFLWALVFAVPISLIAIAGLWIRRNPKRKHPP